jgi:hypothetical protein
MLSCCNNLAIAEDEFLLKMDESKGSISDEELHKYLKAMVDNASEILYTIGICSYYLGVPVMDIINSNFNLLAKRKDAGTLQGSGDGVRRSKK